MLSVKRFKVSQSLCEIYNLGFQMAFVSEKLEQCHPWVLCKDYLVDALWATFNKKKVAIYGFRYDPSDNDFPAISLDPVKIIVRNKELDNNDFDKQIENCCKFINIVEARLKFKMAVIEKVKLGDKGSVWMFTLDKRWIHASPMISMLSLFLRIGCFYNGKDRLQDTIRLFKKNEEGREYSPAGEAKVNDGRYLSQSRRFRLLIMKKGISIFKPKMEDNYPNEEDIHTIHNNWGIVSSAKNSRFKTLWNLEGLDTIGGKSKKKKKSKTLKQKVKIKNEKIIKVAKKKAKKKAFKKKVKA